jgi:GNAT superfamily N-acetyltransferase
MTAAFTVRPARPEDVPAVVSMVHELADFEQAADRCHLTGEQLRECLFGPEPALFGHVAVDAADEPVGMALWFLNFSTWEGTHGVHLEDLSVRPSARGAGLGALLMAALAEVCVRRGYRRLEWVMLDWNPAADFYAAIGATVVEDWRSYRLSDAPLRRLADRAAHRRPVAG